MPPFHGECFWGNFVPYVFMYTLICLACQTSGFSQYFEDTGCLYCWKFLCRLHSLKAMELIRFLLLQSSGNCGDSVNTYED